MAGHAEERKRAIGAVRPISSVINGNKETNVNLISSVGVLICPRDAEPGGITYKLRRFQFSRRLLQSVGLPEAAQETVSEALRVSSRAS